MLLSPILPERPEDEDDLPLGTDLVVMEQCSDPWTTSLRLFKATHVLPEMAIEREWAQTNELNLIENERLLYRVTRNSLGKGSVIRQVNALLVPASLR